MKSFDNQAYRTRLNKGKTSKVEDLETSQGAQTALMACTDNKGPKKVYDDCSINELLKIVANIIERVINENSVQNHVSIYNASKTPKMSILDYLIRIVTYSQATKSTVLCTLILLDRFFENNNEEILTLLNSFKFLGTSLLLASKFNEDVTLSNEDFAKVIGVQLSELNNLENNFIHTLNFDLMISTETFHDYQELMRK